MKALISDLKNRINNPVSTEDISKLLFQLGHENDVQNNIIDIDITPNRGDCLSILGILRDLKNFYEINTKFEVHEGLLDSFKLGFLNEAVKSCPKISFLKIEIDEISPNYAEYLEMYFSELGNKKINLFTDISNYLSYELGQPTHCYDFSKIRNEIVLKTINESKKFETLADKALELSGSNLIFEMDNEVINLAGVMGGKETACSDSTTCALIECAFFEPESIIGKSVKYDLNSEAAHRFERGVDPNCQEFVLRRFIKIVSDHANIKNLELCSHGEKSFEESSIKNNKDKVEKILGTSLKNDEFKNILANLGFQSVNENIKIPSYRNDIFSLNDIAEEIARIIGYDNLPSSEVDILSKTMPSKSTETFVRKKLILEGFSEVINNPFTGSSSKEAFKVDNPLDSNKSYMRTSLKESLINNLLYNERRQKDSIKLFEISDVYSLKSSLLRQKKIGIIASGRIGNNFKEFSKFINENYLNDILKSSLLISDLTIENIARKDLDTKIRTPIFFIELDLQVIKSKEVDVNLLNGVRTNTKYIEISEFPTINRDISFLITNKQKINVVIDLVNKFENVILKEKFIFDFYNDEKSGSVKIGFRFIFQSNEKTLKVEEVDAALKKVIEIIISDEEIDVPGYK